MDTCIDTALSLCALLAPDAPQVQAHPPLEGGGVVCVWGGGTAVTYSSLLDLACQVLRARRRYSVYLLYWYTSTNTDAAASHLPPLQSKLLKASTCNRYSVYLL